MLYGLHPNAEIDFLTTTSEKLFRTVMEMQPKDAGGGDDGGMSKEEMVSEYILSCIFSEKQIISLAAVFSEK